jgi:hypothetical protein
VVKWVMRADQCLSHQDQPREDDSFPLRRMVHLHQDREHIKKVANGKNDLDRDLRRQRKSLEHQPLMVIVHGLLMMRLVLLCRQRRKKSIHFHKCLGLQGSRMVHSRQQDQVQQ